MRSVVIIATEGKETERQYFNMGIFKSNVFSIKLVPRDTKSDPESILKDMRDFVKKQGIKKGDYQWIVIDKNSWTEQQLQKLLEWSKSEDKKKLSISNPLFEYWILLHFEEGDNVHNKEECLRRLNRYINAYNKSNIPVNEFTSIRIDAAIARARKKDTPPCEKWPEQAGTTVYRLIEIIKKQK